MEFLAPVLSIIIGFFSFVLILRTWLQFCRVDPYMPLSQSLLRLTSPLVNPVSKVIPTVKNINFAALLIALLLLAFEKFVLGVPVAMAVLAGLLGVMKTFGKILFFTTLIRALMSWVTRGDHPLDYMVAQITEPVLGFIRKLLPRTGMLDFSVMVLGFGLILLNNLFYRVFGVLWAIA
ncbi:YggT family protein [Actinobacillus pleuropneumoniae]|uniref:Integral membrane protein n=2 Tax=Actinobacillus pleuropneumoniae TaxID=715 RepID=A0A2X3Y6Y9_ACTPL|nr:YggT family protein [Actinobacillus pleuropneumoniae]EFL78910.1 integral membrane protein [Actinobacillus pleuropneumoniae serovar 2 str. 4226]EFL80546.1 integral membrane protein [Actinobacillus pleuropneumoniae serovar 6 str. Femo]EFM87241.1 Predicted integral membrane protein [Actinobacillus pleuropneumoniae serovar 2 str. S1536]EFM89435.1 Predicted integral membrane protein [Actinobacillus pleuropneumoniae serovar 4 str. M62]EFM91511.1 Predicted integral membrane protein [Actinobacillus